MRLSLIIGAAAALAIGAEATEYMLALNTTKSGLDINDIGTGLVSFASGGLWIGGMKYSNDSEPFLPSAPLSFTSWHQTPTGWQDAYLYPDVTQVLRFTIPHSGVVPEHSYTDGLAFDGDGFLIFQGENKFYGCNYTESSGFATYQVWWLGDGQPSGQTCVGPLFLFDAGFTTIG